MLHHPAPHHFRILLCASAAHCAQVLQAAARARVNLHGLQLCTNWPTQAAFPEISAEAPPLVLWALLPEHNSDQVALQLERQWRAHLLQGTAPLQVQMLYGSAAQQAPQLAPWVRETSAGSESAAAAPCLECLDAASEQTLFQHLLGRR